MKKNTVSKEILNEFKSSKRNRGIKLKKRVLSEALSDLDMVLDFERMSKYRRVTFSNLASEMRCQNYFPSENERDKNFRALGTLIKGLGKFRKTKFKWGGIHSSTRAKIADLENELQELHDLRKEWTQGRHFAVNKTQGRAINRLEKMLKNSKRTKRFASKWNTLRIKPFGLHGQFNSRKMVDKSSKTFKATPARLISNLSVGLGVEFSELAIAWAARSPAHRLQGRHFRRRLQTE